MRIEGVSSEVAYSEGVNSKSVSREGVRGERWCEEWGYEEQSCV